MSGLGSLLESERKAERAAAARALLASPLLLADRDADAFAAIVRHREWLSRWFADNPGWKLAVDVASGFARLHKIPPRADSTRGASVAGRPFDRRRYVLFCMTLSVLDECGRQTTLARLAELVEHATKAEESIPPFDPDQLSERRAFVDALRYLTELLVLRLRDGDADQFAHTREGDALYDVDERLLGQLVSCPVPPALAAGPERLLAEVLPETEEGVRLRARYDVMRRLLEDPVLYYDELEPSAFDWLDHSRGFVYRLLSEDLGFAVERRAEGLAAIDPTGEVTDTLFPDGNSTVKHAALLVAEQLAARSRRGELTVEKDEVKAIVRALIDDYADVCHWSRQYGRDDAGAAQLSSDALELLEAFGLVRRTQTDVVIRPAIARFRTAGVKR